jgi:hypothetical protein
MASWQNDLALITKRVERRLRDQPAHVPAKVQAGVLTDLCTLYTNLLIDSSFARDMIEATQQRMQLKDPNSPYKIAFDGEPPDGKLSFLKDHFNTALRLLLEAGVSADYALDAVRSAEEYLTVNNRLLAPSHVELFEKVRLVKRSICGIENDYLGIAISQERKKRIRNGVLAGVGLVLIGLASGGTALVAGAGAGGAAAVGVAAAGAVGVGPAIRAGTEAVITTIGSTIFQKHADELTRET